MTRLGRLPVVLMWHMHQPQYRDSSSGQYVLPWTYLHAIKDYTDMAAHLEAHPDARAVVNFTPVLLEQLDELAERVASHLATGSVLPDPVLALLGPDPIPQSGPARLELLLACLRAQRKHMIERFGPYLELATIAETLATVERVPYASDQLIHDLAVWYHIAWMGETVRRSDARIAALTEQGRGFSREQRRELLVLIGELLARIIPRFRLLAEHGQCELSVSPYAHPIVPLLLDFQAARESAPASSLPRHPAYQGGNDRAAWHVAESIRIFTDHFGARPQGCWPSEGAISQGTLELLDRFGFRWAASSSNVLRATLGAGGDETSAFNRPYRLPAGNLRSFFRDDRLSDLVGFTYATWHGDDAAQNLVHELAQLARKYSGDAGHAVLIALDGENAWEHYPFNGYYFLGALYKALTEHPVLELTTLSECVARGIPAVPLPRVVAGSWVHGTLGTWMGDAAKNAAWDLLCEAKQAYDEVCAQSQLDGRQRTAVERQLALCESSDWFWWFGDYNPPEAVSQFDQLFRRQLTNLYRLLKRPVPENLARPISVGRGTMEHGGVMRRAFAT
jgi:alpha-amylase/alpha-mannosidase (GH57 family)